MAVDVRRLALVLTLVAAALAVLFAVALRDPADEEAGFTDARLLEAPTAEADGAPLKVGLRDGEQAPDFEISTMDGERVRLSDLRGKPVVISFYALWCGGCLAEMPVLKAAQGARGLDNLTVLAVNAGETRDRAQEFIDVIQAPFTWTLDFDLTVTDAYAVHGLPHTVFIDAGGIVRTTFTGVTNRARLDTYLDATFEAAAPAALPDEIRFVTRIPRDHVLEAATPDPGVLVLTSRRLRCDLAYCAGSLADALRATPGVRSVTPRPGPTPSAPSIEVTFDPAATTPDALIALTVAHLAAIPDPLFRNIPLIVRPAGSGSAEE